MMRLLKGFLFALFPGFQKSADFDRQCGDDPPGGNFHAERSSNGLWRRSSRTPAHGRRRLMSWSSRRRWTPTSAVFQNFLMDEGSKGTRLCAILMGLTAGNAAGYRSGVRNTGIEDILVLPAVPVVPLLPGPALRDGFSHVLGLRIVVPEAFAAPLWPAVAAAAMFTSSDDCGVSSRQLLRQRPSTSQWDRNINWDITFVDASWRATPLVVAGCGHHVPALTVTSGGRCVGSDEACSDKSSRGREQHNEAWTPRSP